MNFVESTPKSILKKKNKATSEKKRKLSFRDTFSDQLDKIPKIEETSMAEEAFSTIKGETEMINDIEADNILNEIKVKQENDSLPDIDIALSQNENEVSTFTK